MERTIDPDVVVEERRDGYVRYRNVTSGRRWEVHGECVKIGRCMVGAIVDGRELRTLREARAYIRERPLLLDSPVTPEFEGCCPFRYVELEPA